MSVVRRTRGSDSAVVERITHVTYAEKSDDVSTPDGCWDIVVQRHAGKITMLQTGLITRPVALPYDAGDEYISISFKPGVFMPRTPGVEMIDRGVVLPATSGRAFWLQGETLEIPTFENAEGLVARLIQHGLIVRDEIVERLVAGRPKAASPRSVQRHFVHALGVTAKGLTQIQRACRAVDLLQQGRPAADVAADLGYADQPHLNRSLKRLMGRTPGDIARTARR
jgi:AraC-like DNA-binding protein